MSCVDISHFSIGKLLESFRPRVDHAHRGDWVGIGRSWWIITIEKCWHALISYLFRVYPNMEWRNHRVCSPKTRVAYAARGLSKQPCFDSMCWSRECSFGKKRRQGERQTVMTLLLSHLFMVFSACCSCLRSSYCHAAYGVLRCPLVGVLFVLLRCVSWTNVEIKNKNKRENERGEERDRGICIFIDFTSLFVSMMTFKRPNYSSIQFSSWNSFAC